MKYCVKCSKDYPNDVNFCNMCGSSLQVKGTNDYLNTVKASAEKYVPKAEETVKRVGKKKLIIAGALAAVVMICILVGVNLFGTRKITDKDLDEVEYIDKCIARKGYVDDIDYYGDYWFNYWEDGDRMIWVWFEGDIGLPSGQYYFFGGNLVKAALDYVEIYFEDNQKFAYYDYNDDSYYSIGRFSANPKGYDTKDIVEKINNLYRECNWSE